MQLVIRRPWVSRKHQIDIEKQDWHRETSHRSKHQRGKERSEKECKAKQAKWIKPAGGRAAKWARRRRACSKVRTQELKQRSETKRKENWIGADGHIETSHRLKNKVGKERSEEKCNKRPAKWINPADGRRAKWQRKVIIWKTKEARHDVRKNAGFEQFHE